MGKRGNGSWGHLLGRKKEKKEKEEGKFTRQKGILPLAGNSRILLLWARLHYVNMSRNLKNFDASNEMLTPLKTKSDVIYSITS